MLGLLYDVHGNLPALEAVLDDAGDVDSWLLGGDYTLFGAWPAQTLERLRGLDTRPGSEATASAGPLPPSRPLSPCAAPSPGAPA